MSGTTILVRPVTAQLDREGRILKADVEMLRLQQAANGDEDGILAIPSLLDLALRTAHLRLALASKLIISDNSRMLEAWAESRWDVESESVYLAILSLREVEADSTESPSALPVSDMSGILTIETDRSLRILAFSGAFPQDFEYRFLGKKAQQLLQLGDQEAVLQRAVEAEQALSLLAVELSGLENSYTLEARPQFATDGRLIGYLLELEPLEQVAAPAMTETETSPPINDAENPFFSEQLAPALRQPIGRIIANAETIGEKLKGPLRDNYAAYAKDIANAAKHLSGLVDDIGDLAAIERDDFQPAKDRVDLGDAAHRVAGLLALKASDHNIQIQLPDQASDVIATAEFRRVLQILLNLLNNAIRYSPDGSKIAIDIAQLDDTACITVSDNGSGILEADYEKVFEKFERLGRSGDGGSGLGLYISRRLARAMGGDLMVSKSRTGGACFALTLPAAT